MREVYIVIDDPRKLIEVLDKLNYFNIASKGIDIGIKYIHGIVLTDSGGHRYLLENNVYVDGYTINIDECGVEKGIAIAIVHAKSLYTNPLRKLVVGIDYGRNIGIAIVANDDVIYIHSYRSIEYMLRDIKFFVENIESETKVIRIGIAQDVDENFTNVIVEMFKNIAIIEFVPEYRSSKHKYLFENIKLKSDEIAAINIALYRGIDID